MKYKRVIDREESHFWNAIWFYAYDILQKNHALGQSQANAVVSANDYRAGGRVTTQTSLSRKSREVMNLSYILGDKDSYMSQHVSINS